MLILNGMAHLQMVKINLHELYYIMQNIPQIKVPDTDINTISLSQLTLTEDNTKKCVDGYTEGITWIGGRCTEYQFTLIFK